MKRTEKEQLVSELAQKLRGASALYYTDFTGLNVKRMTDLRRRLRKSGVEYVVIKNTLALRAVNESGLVSERLRGPTGLVLSRDPVTAAKGVYVRNVAVSSTMGPGVRIDTTQYR